MLREDRLISSEMVKCESSMLHAMFHDFLNDVDIDNLPTYDKAEQRDQVDQIKKKIKVSKDFILKFKR